MWRSPGTYDQKHFDRIGGIRHVVAYGPGRLDVAHQPDEWCSIEDLINATKVIALTRFSSSRDRDGFHYDLTMTNNLFSLENRVVVVVGAGSGIGEAVAIGAAGQGARVACLDVKARHRRSQPPREFEAAEALPTLPRSTSSTALPLTRRYRRSPKRLGRLDALVCTPAINVRKKILDYSDDEFDRRGQD